MMIEEFEQRTGYFPSSAEYKAIEAAYMEFDGDKDEFCKAYKKNANGIAERIRREVNAAAFKESRQHTADLTRRDIEIERLKKQLEREQEWKPYEDADAVSQADYDELATSGGTDKMTDDEAKALLYNWYGFAKEMVVILRTAPIYEINRHRQLREVGAVDRAPLYNSTDWNYIRFTCGRMSYELYNDALKALRLDPRAVALNGYYLGHFGDMTIDDIAAGIRWHYERGTNALADDDTLMQARADIEAARQQAAEAGLPFSERLVDGSDDQLNPYTYDGSMTPEDYEAMQQVRDTRAALVEVVTGHYPNADEEAIERIAEAASSMKLSPEAVQRILDAFDRITETIKDLCEWAAQTIRTLADFFTETLGDFMLRRAPPKWRHYALHAKRARVRKKYRNRIRRAFFAALASEGGGSS